MTKLRTYYYKGVKRTATRVNRPYGHSEPILRLPMPLQLDYKPEKRSLTIQERLSFARARIIMEEAEPFTVGEKICLKTKLIEQRDFDVDRIFALKETKAAAPNNNIRFVLNRQIFELENKNKKRDGWINFFPNTEIHFNKITT